MFKKGDEVIFVEANHNYSHICNGGIYKVLHYDEMDKCFILDSPANPSHYYTIDGFKKATKFETLRWKMKND